MVNPSDKNKKESQASKNALKRAPSAKKAICKVKRVTSFF